MDAQIESAIELAFNPHTDQNLKAQAYDFLNRLRTDDNGWQVCLALFTRSGSTSEVVRLVCLEIVNNAVQVGQVGQYGLSHVKESLMGYVRKTYSDTSREVDSPAIQNKLTQTLTYLFTSLYASDWTGFFDDFKDLAGGDASIGTGNPFATLLYLRIVGSVHDEIADVMIPRTPEEQRHGNELKDLIRARDVSKIAITWQEILSRWRQTDLTIIELCLRTIAKWVSWIDITVVVDRNIQLALLELAGQERSLEVNSKEAKARDAAIDTFTEIVGKKMAPRDKIELIRYLNLSDVVAQLCASEMLSKMQKTSNYDTDLAESVAKLVNNIVFDVVRVLSSEHSDGELISRANDLLQRFLPHLLRFLADEYDEICTAILPSLTELVSLLRSQARIKDVRVEERRQMLRPILNAVIVKMKYDETTDWGDEDEATDEAEFQELRKKLHVLQQTIAAADEGLYIEMLTQLVESTFSILASRTNRVESDWRDLDLAMHEMYLFGELAVKNGGLYNKSTPSSEASQRLLDMMSKMVQSNLAAHPHPAIQLQYMEICVRYVQFFEHNPTSISQVLERFVGFVHSKHPRVRLRSWYLFQRFVRHLRAHLGGIASTVVQAIADLLVIKAEPIQNGEQEDDSSDSNTQSSDAAFTSQLYLFEAVGCIASTSAILVDTKVAIAQSINKPLIANLHQCLEAARYGDTRAQLQVHHIVMALGTFANGFSDWAPGASAGKPPPQDVSVEFLSASEAVLVALEALRDSPDVRNASRHAFSRFLGVLGSSILSQLPRWIEGLLSSASSNDEMAMFLRTLAQVVYGFKGEIYSILDTLLTPLLQRVFTGLELPTTGTDDEIQLRELKQQYLNFILVILNNELGGVLVSQTNQSMFESFINNSSRFATDISDPQSARLAFSSLTRIVTIWGGPDLTLDSNEAASPALPGFDGFILSQFAPLPWRLVSTPGFNSGDAQMRSVVHEAAALQWTVFRKTGRQYHGQLQAELRELGVGEEGAREYLKSIAGDVLGFRKFFAGFVQQAKR